MSDLQLPEALSSDPAFAILSSSGEFADLATPALVCDVGPLSRNVVRMGAWSAEKGLRLRPHAKSHKSAHVARLQLDSGATGIACAKLSEAESLVSALSDREDLDVLVTSPIAGPRLAERAAALAGRCHLTVALDDHRAVVEVVGALSRRGTHAAALCDVDVGLGRTGVTSARAALDVAEAVTGPLHFDGVQGYAGHVQHISPRPAREAAAREAADRLGEVVHALEAAGHACRVRSGAGTGSAAIDAELGVLNEIQPGSYVFMDREYRDAIGGDPEGRFEQSLFVMSRVISANHTGHVTVDAGLKSMSTDAGPAVVAGRPELTYGFFGDEQGLVAGAPDLLPRLGEALWLIPPHCDPTVNLYDWMWLVDSGRIIGVEPVTARGRSY